MALQILALMLVDLYVNSKNKLLFFISCRLFGLVGIIYTDCSAPLVLHVRPYLDWPQCASPAVILALYWLLATETRFYFINVCNKIIVPGNNIQYFSRLSVGGAVWRVPDK